MSRKSNFMLATVLAIFALSFLGACDNQTVCEQSAEPTDAITEHREMHETATAPPEANPPEAEEICTLSPDRRIVKERNIGKPMLFMFDLWEAGEFEYRLVITIKDHRGGTLQQIGGLYQITSPFTPIDGEGRQPVFADLNFDGYLDLRIWREFHSERGHGWASHYHFIWDGTQFVQSEEFDVLRVMLSRFFKKSYQQKSSIYIQYTERCVCVHNRNNYEICAFGRLEW